jgi:hypothetical protein
MARTLYTTDTTIWTVRRKTVLPTHDIPLLIVSVALTSCQPSTVAMSMSSPSVLFAVAQSLSGSFVLRPEALTPARMSRSIMTRRAAR